MSNRITKKNHRPIHHITMIGAGYVGLVTGACFAALGHQVTCIDKDKEKIANLKKGEIPIYEANLKELVDEALSNQTLFFNTDLKSGIDSAEVIFVAVGTPSCPITGQADLQYIEGLARELAPLLNEHDDKVIVLKSTVPVGTGAHFKELIQTLNPKAKFDMVSNPEFLREGSAVFDFMNPDRIIMGCETEKSRSFMQSIYAAFLDQEMPILFTDIKSSELIKYAANCFLATKLAFMNEIADLCEKTGANVENVIKGLGLDKRIGPGHLQPGPGFGGSCFPKDTRALLQMAESFQSPFSIVEAVVQSNENRKRSMIDKILQIAGGDLTLKRMAILGVAFKANTDDIRESSALVIIQGLQALDALLHVYDPAAMEKAAAELQNSRGIKWARSAMEAIQDAEIVVIVTEWPEFQNIKWKTLNKKPKIIIDLRNLYDLHEMQGSGVSYHSIGRPAVIAESSVENVENTESVLLT